MSSYCFINYIYFSKAENEKCKVMRQCTKEACVSGKIDLAKMKAAAAVYPRKQKYSVQMTVY